MLPKKQYPPHTQEQLDQLTFVIFGQGDATQSLSCNLISATQSHLQKYPHLSSYEAGDLLAKIYTIAEGKIIEGTAIIDDLNVLTVSEQDEKEYKVKNLEFWLRRISHNVVRDLSKKERRLNNGSDKLKSHIQSQDLHIYPDSSVLGTENCKHWDDTKEKSLQKALSKLSAKDKDILLLRYIDDLGWEEISEKLGIKESTGRKRGSRALQRLRDIFFSLYPVTEKGGES